MYLYLIGSLGDFGTNCYALYDQENNAYLIDAPCCADYILKCLNQKGLNLKAILLTHGHCDHIGAVIELHKETNCDVFIHPDDRVMLEDSRINLMEYFNIPGFVPFDAIKTFESDVFLDANGNSIKIIHTPGHTQGSVTFLVDDKWLFTGDTLFDFSIGRTDFPGGDYEKIMNSLKKLASLPRNYKVYPGHGNSTDLSTQKAFNPFLKD